MDKRLKYKIKQFTKSILDYDVVCITLTYKQHMYFKELGRWEDLTEDIMEQNLKHFLNLINSKVFGNGFKRYGKKLKILSKNEYSINRRLHNHLILEKPKRYDYLIFSKIIIQSINKTDWMYMEHHINHPTSMNEKMGWFNYIMKGDLINNPNNSIDWNNTVL